MTTVKSTPMAWMRQLTHWTQPGMGMEEAMQEIRGGKKTAVPRNGGKVNAVEVVVEREGRFIRGGLALLVDAELKGLLQQELLHLRGQ